MIINNIFFLTGIFWKILSCLCFAIINIFVRYLSGGSLLEVEYPISVYNIMFFQNVIVIIMLIPFFLKKNLGTIYSRLHILRIIFASFGVFFFYLSLKFLSITKVITLGFINPILTVFCARLFLNEKMNIKKTIILISVLFSTFLIIKSDLNYFNSEINFLFFPIISSLFFVLDKVVSRKVIILENKSLLLNFYLFLTTIPVYTFFLFTNGLDVIKLYTFVSLFFLGLLTVIANYSFNKAFSYIEIIVLIPYGLSKFIISCILEYIFFKETPKMASVWIGITIIVIATLLFK